MKVALITGANGMDAKTLARFLQHKPDYTVVLTYRRNSLFDIAAWFRETQIEDKHRSRFQFTVCDITDQNSVRECIKGVLRAYGQLDELYMLAGMTHVGNSFSMREYSILCNGQSYYFFLEALKDLSRTTRVYGAMTSELAGNVPDGYAFDEETVWYPRSPYSIGKNLGGNWIQFYRESMDSQLFACFGILFNHSNHFRTNDFYVMKVCHAAAEIVAGKSSHLSLGNLGFYRDEHFSDFGVEMMWKMLQQPSPRDYVVGTGTCHHGEEYLNLAFSHFNLDWRKHVVIDESLKRANEVHRLVANPERAKRELGWNPQRMSFNDHMRLMCEYAHAKVTNQYYVLPNIHTLYP